MTGGWEDPVERRLREAIERGEFDNLPGAGRPLRTDDMGPGWWLRKTIARSRLNDRVAGAARQVEEELGGLWRLADEAGVRAEVARLNGVLAEVNQHVAPEQRADLLDPDQVVRIWHKMVRARPRGQGPAGSASR